MERNTRIEEELFPFYALDALSQEEREEVERYVAGNPEAQARLMEAMSAAAAFVADLEPITPSPVVKQRLMARIEAESPAAATQTPSVAASPPSVRQATSTARVKRSWWPRGLGGFYFGRALGFAILLLLLGTFGLWQMWRQVGELRSQVSDLQLQVTALEGDAARLRDEADLLRAENDGLQERLAASEDMLARYRQPGATTIAIGDATGANPAAVGTLTFNPTTSEAILSVSNLPLLPAGSTYQAWLIVGETPVSAGMFNVDETGTATHTIPDMAPGGFDAVGVSMEPEGGSDQPTPGNIVLLGGLSS